MNTHIDPQVADLMARRLRPVFHHIRNALFVECAPGFDMQKLRQEIESSPDALRPLENRHNRTPFDFALCSEPWQNFLMNQLLARLVETAWRSALHVQFGDTGWHLKLISELAPDSTAPSPLGHHHQPHVVPTLRLWSAGAGCATLDRYWCTDRNHHGQAWQYDPVSGGGKLIPLEECFRSSVAAGSSA